MKDIKDDNKIKKEEKEEKIKNKLEKRQSIPLAKNSLFVKNQKSSIATNYFMNVKQNNPKKPLIRHSFIKEPEKKNQILTMKQEKISLNKTLEVNNYKNSLKNNTNKNKNIKKNSLYLNQKADNNGSNNQKNNLVRKSMILINNNKESKLNKIPDKRTSLVLQKNKNSIRINKDKGNNMLEKILENNEDKKDVINNEQEIKNKNDYKRAYSRKPTERERQKKLNKLNKNSFGAVAKYTKKTAPYVNLYKKDINKNNIINKPKNKMQRTKTNYNISSKENKIINNINKTKGNNFKKFDWSNRNLPELKKINKNINHKKIRTNLYDKYYIKKENNELKEKQNKIENRKNNPIFKTLTFRSVLTNNKSNIKSNNKNMNKKFELNNKNKKFNHAGSMILRPPKKDLNRGKSAVSIRNQNTKISKKIVHKNDNQKKIINLNIKKVTKSFIEKKDEKKEKEKNDKNKEEEQEKEKKEEEEKEEKEKEKEKEDDSESSKSDSSKNSENIQQKKVEDESDSEDDEDDEGDFDIYAMIRSKSCGKRMKKDTKNNASENSEESDAKSFSSEEECDIESILYRKEQKQIFKNIEEEDNNNDTNSIVKCIDFDEVYLTSNNMFTENIQKNNLYNKYIQKFDEIFDKVIVKIKEKKKIIDEKNKTNKEENNEKKSHILNQSDLTEDDSTNKNANP